MNIIVPVVIYCLISYIFIITNYPKKKYILTVFIGIWSISLVVALVMHYTRHYYRNPEYNCNIDEKRNRLGRHKCFFDNECLGKRTCSSNGKCMGESKC